MPGEEIACNASATLTWVAGTEQFLGSPLHEVTAQATATPTAPEFFYPSAIDAGVMIIEQTSKGTLRVQAKLT